MNYNKLQIEKELQAKGYKYVCGIDESGVGAFAGGFTVGALILDLTKPYIEGIDDSKKLSKNKKRILEPLIKNSLIDYRIIYVSADEINKAYKKANGATGSFRALHLNAMKQAIDSLKVKPDYVIVDGKYTVPSINIPQTSFIKGDQKSACVGKGTKILMENFTLKPIEKVKIGEYILTIEENRSTYHSARKFIKAKVLKTFKFKNKEVVKTTDKNNSIITTADHKFLLKTNTNGLEWRTIVDSTSNKNRGEIRAIKYAVSLNNLNSYFEGVLFGLIDSDGFCTKTDHRCGIGQKLHKDSVEWLLNKLNISFCKVKHGKCEGMFTYWINKKPNRQLYKKLDFWRTNFDKSLKHYTNKDFMRGYLAGVILGDGNITSKGYFRIEKRDNARTWIPILKILDTLNIKYSIHDKYNTFIKAQNKLLTIFKTLDIPYIIPGKKKIKYDKFLCKKTSNSLDKTKIKTKVLNKKQTVYDLETTGHSYIANSFVIHNSIAGASILARIHRERVMEELATKYEGYAHWKKTYGYCSTQEIVALNKLGPTLEHRVCFIENTLAYRTGKIIKVNDTFKMKECPKVKECPCDYIKHAKNYKLPLKCPKGSSYENLDY